jgi:hypothetical protein
VNKLLNNYGFMKKITLLGSLFLSLCLQAQTFTDNFDSYTAGSYLCPQSGGAWTTWSNAPGGAEDVLVSSADAVSGSNSLRFVSTSTGGGPTDLIRHFGILNTGQFSMEFNLKVAVGAAAYFNFQKTASMGATYTLDAIFSDDGSLNFSQQSTFSALYPQGSWFNFRMEINFNTNLWEVFIDDVFKGSFSNAQNQIEAIDIYPVDQNAPTNSDFFIDDFSTTITPYTLTALNGGITYAGFNGGNVVGNAVTPSFKVRNLGVSQITSFDIAATYNGATINQSYTGLTLASFADQTFTMTSSITLVAGLNPITYTISNVNGLGADGDAADDTGAITVNPIVPAAGKMVVSEEATGTWCGFCVRGAVFMDQMNDLYGNYWAGLAVHNGDPMADAVYDAALTALPGFSGFPTAYVDRVSPIDPSEMETSILSRLQVAPKAVITNGATFDAVSRTLSVSVTATFQSAATNGYKLACVISEDNVTGTVSGYAQSNYYANNAYGPMGGYESLPSTVPAAQMVYDHVARGVQPSFAGTNAGLPTTIIPGALHTINASFVLPATWDETKMHIVGLLMDPTGKIDNAGKSTISEAVTNGFVAGIQSISSDKLEQVDDLFQLYPNPATTSATVMIQLQSEALITLKVMDMAGKEVIARNYGWISGASSVEMNTAHFEPGMYLVELTVNNQKMTKRLIVH